MPEPGPHEILGVSPGASPAEIRAAFRRKVRASHPDTNEAPGEDDVIAVVEAYRALLGGRGGREPGPRAGGTASSSSVEVRAGSPTSPRSDPVRCRACGGAGSVTVRTDCPGCGGRGVITRLEAHRSGPMRCPRCLGRAATWRRQLCTRCEGSGVEDVHGGD